MVRNLITGEISSHAGDAVVLATGGYGNVFFLSTNAKGCNVTATWRAYKKGAFFANPCYTQIHPTCIPVSGEHQSKLTLMSESLRNDGRVWVPKRKEDCAKAPGQIPEADRDYYLERKYPELRQPRARATSPRAPPRKSAMKAAASARAAWASTWILRDRSSGWAKTRIRERYGNLFDMYEKITGENAYQVPMRIYPAVHYAMGGTWVDYNLMSTLPGLFVLGEANFSDHGANRLGASALMQGLADGYFVLPYTIGNYFAVGQSSPSRPPSHAEFKKAEADGQRVHEPPALDQRQAHADFPAPRAGQAALGEMRHGAQRSRA